MRRAADAIDLYQIVPVKTIPGLHEGLELVRIGDCLENEMWIRNGCDGSVQPGPAYKVVVVRVRPGWTFTFQPMRNEWRVVKAFDPPLRVSMEFEVKDTTQLEWLQSMCDLKLSQVPGVLSISHPKEETNVEAIHAGA